MEEHCHSLLKYLASFLVLYIYIHHSFWGVLGFNSQLIELVLCHDCSHQLIPELIPGFWWGEKVCNSNQIALNGHLCKRLGWWNSTGPNFTFLCSVCFTLLPSITLLTVNCVGTFRLKPLHQRLDWQWESFVPWFVFMIKLCKKMFWTRAYFQHSMG